MTFSRRYVAAALLFLFCISTVSNLKAQRNISYQELAMRNQNQTVFFDFITLPGEKDDKVIFTTVFSFPYSSMPFKKNKKVSSASEYFSVVDLSLEVFEANKKDFGNTSKNRNISVEGLKPVARAFSSDTAFAKTYEESQSKKQFLNGALSTALSPGIYHYVLMLKRGEETENRISRTQSVRITPYNKRDVGNIILGEQVTVSNNTPRLKLSNLGQNAEYSKDFYALAYLPEYEKEANYSVQITSLNVKDQDTSKVNQIYSSKIKDIRTGVKPVISLDDESFIELRSDEDGFAYALVEVPNSKFPNSLYRMHIQKEGKKRPAAQTSYRSIWIDMPTSLLNLDVAIDMLEYIVDDQTLDRLSSGTRTEREKKFRQFWEKRDPTPKTEFNELMAEYYRRIDYAYENFTTNNTAGHKSDRGEVYIKFGPPKDISRKFPTNGSTREIWTYKDRKFIFRATTGFGDFKLLSEESTKDS